MSKGRRTHEARAMNLPPCPKCGAGRGECCMRRNGKARPAHSERRIAAVCCAVNLLIDKKRGVA